MTNQEINEAVARKLGYQKCGNDNRYWHDPKTDKDFDTPDYCTDIKAAWEVVEFANKYAFEIHTTNPGYLAMFTGPTWKQMVEARADTAPMAICLAFLKAP